METIKLSLYEKNKETGIFEDLLGAYVLEDHVALLDKAYAVDENGLKVHLYLTVAGEVEDSEYEAIYEQYDGEGFNDMDVTIEEVEDSYNPTWLFIFDFIADSDEMGEMIDHILEIHNSELERILKNIRTTK
ncbi:DUF6762 family protein [Alkaliphilus oremlandii]|uniref:Uncharacterized protein n=1 Tax=Alkaliphilus oremlandii (strain OhILAs) TaxID=350688 RepID=A8MIH1_ALKOO|nr:DUF6762 family protein [Alkaliphilus oremlandii]ABW19603.1 conserved hypothetical protein [Alkaliphilus oremlandii OhILAs]